MNSLIIPVYGNAGSMPELLQQLRDLSQRLTSPLEVVFVVDASPDDSFAILKRELPQQPFASQLLAHSRNFGSFAGIRSGLAVAQGSRFAVMAADLQEPIELAESFFVKLANDEADVLVGTRDGRADPLGSRIASSLFWGFYRRFVVRNVPPGGVDVFACNDVFRRHLLDLDESHSSLIGLIFWLGFRRAVVPYTRLARRHGQSGWNFSRKLRYMTDSIFAFTDLPIRLLMAVGMLGLAASTVLGLVVLVLRLASNIAVPGYTATMIAILFFGGLNALGLGIVGAYVWRAYANTQRRPQSVVMSRQQFAAATAQQGNEP